MNRLHSHPRLPVLITAVVLAVAATGMLLLTKHAPATDASVRPAAPGAPVRPAASAAGKPAPNALPQEVSTVALSSVSVRGEVITAYTATVPERVWHESATAQPSYAVPAPSYEAFPHDPPAPGVPIIDSPLRPADAAPPQSFQK